jgi:hypothetical protein
MGGLEVAVYFLRNSANGLIKIGWTRGLVSARIKSVRSCEKLGRDIEVIRIIPEWHYYHERRLHFCYRSRHVRGEWFHYHWTMMKIINIKYPECLAYRYKFVEAEIKTNNGRVTRQQLRPDIFGDKA